MKKMFLFLLCMVTIAVLILPNIPFVFKTEKEEPMNEDEQKKDMTATEMLLDVPTLCQYPTLPTGCESVAAAMVLQYYDADITAEEFASDWLERSTAFYSANGRSYGPDPHEVFVGDPFTDNAYGCFADPIVKAINRSCTIYSAEKITGKSLKLLCKEYIDNEKPLMIWATMSMKESKAGRTWYLENDAAFTWIAGEHCLVLVGYNDGYYFLNDPMSGSTVAYQKSVVEKRFDELGKQAVYICKKS